MHELAKKKNYCNWGGRFYRICAYKKAFIEGIEVLGIDNLNSYYNPLLKKEELRLLKNMIKIIYGVFIKQILRIQKK